VNNIMLDLETLGTTPGSVVLSIGAVAFDKDEGLGATFYRTISVASSMKAGLTIDASTLLWWSKQDRAAYQEALDKNAEKLEDVLHDFGQWLLHIGEGEYREHKLWGNGADFDLTLLLACYRAVDSTFEPPWKFWNHRCYRTLKALYPEVPAEKRNNHNALDDARNQAEHAVAILRAMR
jgi:hypothetical protein